MMDIPLAIAFNAIVAMTPLLFAGIGGLFTELSGTLNIALEGLILVGAFAAAAAANASGSIAVGLLSGGFFSALLAIAFGFVTIRLKANVFITGLATNIFASGIVALLSRQFFETRSVVAFAIPAIVRPLEPSLGRIPLFGRLLFSHGWLTYISWLFVVLAWLLLFRTTIGTKLRATGANSEAVTVSGFSPDRYRLIAFAASGIACGFAGASLSLPLSAFVPNMSAGRGWIALVAIFLGRRSPVGISLACLVFALAESYSNYAQGVFKIPSEFILAIPYIVTLIALIAGSLVHANDVK
jgi:simple sugar transport system permease protein